MIYILLVLSHFFICFNFQWPQFNGGVYKLLLQFIKALSIQFNTNWLVLSLLQELNEIWPGNFKLAGFNPYNIFISENWRAAEKGSCPGSKESQSWTSILWASNRTKIDTKHANGKITGSNLAETEIPNESNWWARIFNGGGDIIISIWAHADHKPFTSNDVNLSSSKRLKNNERKECRHSTTLLKRHWPPWLVPWIIAS